MTEYIEREALLARVKEKSDLFDKKIAPFSAGLYKYLAGEVEAMPAADVVEVEVVEKWLYAIALNNVGCQVKDFATACEEIVSRLDGLRVFAGLWADGDTHLQRERRGEDG